MREEYDGDSVYKTIAVMGLNPQLKADLEKYATSNFPEFVKVKILDISDKTPLEIRTERDISCVLVNDEFIDSEKRPILESLVKNIKTEDQIENVKFIPITQKLLSVKQAQAIRESIRNLYTNLSFKDKEKVEVSPENIEKIHSEESFFDMTIKAPITQYIALTEGVNPDIRRNIFVEDLFKATEKEHPYTRGHLERVGKFTEETSKMMKTMYKNTVFKNKEYQVMAKFLAQIHDVGKLAISYDILNSPDKFNSNSIEKGHLDTHTSSGIAFVTSALLAGKFRYNPEEGITKHHDRESKNPFANIIKVADCFDAMSSDRGYNEPKNYVDCLRDLLYNSDARFGGVNPNKGEKPQFNKRLTKAFIKVLISQAASIGYDTKEMINSVKGECLDSRIKYYSPELDNELISFCEGIEVNKEAQMDEYCDLGFKLGPDGRLLFENAERFRANVGITVEEKQRRIKNETYYDMLYEYFRKLPYDRKKPLIDAVDATKDNKERKITINPKTIVELMEDDEKSRYVDNREMLVADRLLAKENFGRKIVERGYKGKDQIFKNILNISEKITTSEGMLHTIDDFAKNIEKERSKEEKERSKEEKEI